jgi:hypothetical protein
LEKTNGDIELAKIKLKKRQNTSSLNFLKNKYGEKEGE